VTPETTWVPFSVLNTQYPGANTRLVWTLLTGKPVASSDHTNASLVRQTGLDRKTVRHACEFLSRSPLAPCYAKARSSCAAIPAALLTAPNLSAVAKLLYGQLQSLPDFAKERCTVTYGALSRLTGSCEDTLRQGAIELVTAGWLTCTRENRRSPLCFTLCNPVQARWRARISSIKRRVCGNKKHKGETLLREFLNALVALDDGQNDATPDFLVNPYTRELMEFDRYYPSACVAVEFNGDQHYEQTDLASLEETVKQVGRDAMKAFLARMHRGELVIIHPEDLSLKTLQQKLPLRLPRRELEGMEPLLDALNDLATEYRERTGAERERLRQRGTESQ